jgi:riboflavin biosynthesis pyrimidine reductase
MVFPVSADLNEDGVDAAYAWPEGPWLRANMVATIDGAATGPDGRSESISSPADKDLFGRLRATADAVLVGAGTARIEDYGPARRRARYVEQRTSEGRSPAPTVVVVTRSGDLDPAARLFTETVDGLPRSTPIIVTCTSAVAATRTRLGSVAEVIACGTDAVDLAVMRTVLGERGLVRLHCEGGPRLLGDLIAADLVDELLLTTTPVLTGDRGGPIAVGGDLRRARLAHLLESEGTLFARWRLRDRPVGLAPLPAFGSGGTLPGVDLSSMSSVMEILDDEIHPENRR